MTEDQIINQIKLIIRAKGNPDKVSLRFIYVNAEGKYKEVYLRFAA